MYCQEKQRSSNISLMTPAQALRYSYYRQDTMGHHSHNETRQYYLGSFKGDKVPVNMHYVPNAIHFNTGGFGKRTSSGVDVEGNQAGTTATGLKYDSYYAKKFNEFGKMSSEHPQAGGDY